MTEQEIAKICKALGDENRVKIIKMLTSGELCACKILDALSVTQPTLSHHMKILSEAGLVSVRREGKWSYYAIQCDSFSAFKSVIGDISCAKQCSCDCK
ncbi:MAG: winged helix-turn-helix transcriptional regulator [Treponema sp.]|nr:winged helix-turn-helix transcriptional regulator [Treponema sp.]